MDVAYTSVLTNPEAEEFADIILVFVGGIVLAESCKVKKQSGFTMKIIGFFQKLTSFLNILRNRINSFYIIYTKFIECITDG